MLAIWVAAAVLLVAGVGSLRNAFLAVVVLAAFSLTKCSLTIAAIAALATVVAFHCLHRRFVFGASLVAGYALVSEVELIAQDCSTRWALPENSLDVVFPSNFRTLARQARAQEYDP